MTDENKAVPVSPSALIPVGGSNFFNMQDLDQLRSMEASAPAWHGNSVRNMIANGKVREENNNPEHLITGRAQAKDLPTFGIGSRVRNKEGKKATIIQAVAGYTKKTNTPVHKVSDKKGNIWLEKQTNLELIL